MEDLAALYSDALERLRERREEAVRRTTAVMASTAGWQAAAKAAAAEAVLEATMSECDAVVATLVQAHARTGERNVEEVVRRLREDILYPMLPPGLSLLQGSGPESAALAAALEEHGKEFAARRSHIERSIAKRFTAARDQVDDAPTLPLADRTPARRVRERPWLFAFLVLTALLSLVGVSWGGLLRALYEALAGAH